MERISSKFVHILLYSEHLRARLHSERDQIMIKDRRYHLRMYPTCFVGKDLVDWFLRRGEASNRLDAVQFMCVLQDHNLIHHVCDDHVFKDDMLFYRFRMDDHSLPITRDIGLVLKGYNISQKIKSEENSIMKQQQCEDLVFRNCFVGSALVDWMVETGETSDRFEAVILSRELLELGLVKHGKLDYGKQYIKPLIVQDTLHYIPVTDDHHFKDDPNLHFQFVIDKIISKKLCDGMSLLEGRQSSNPPGPPLMGKNSKQLSPLVMTKRSIPVPSSNRTNDVNDGRFSPESPDFFPSSCSPENISPRPVIVREITVEELLDSTGPYTMKTIRIMSDSVGFGFVVRGKEPVYVQTVDPEGPAAGAGLKVRMFIHSVNGKEVLHWSHKEVAKEMMKGQNVVDLVVMTHFRGT